jgi:hypothetical protein
MALGVGAMALALWPGAQPSVLRLVLALFAAVFLLVFPARNVVGGARRGGAAAFPAELNRARRYGRALSLVRFGCAEGQGTAQDLAATLTERLREDDAVWSEGRNVYVLLPEAARMDAASFVRRFRRTVTTSPDVSVVVASFPEDGATTGALMECLEKEKPLPVDVLLDRLGAVVTPAFVDIRNIQISDPTPPTAPVRLLAVAERAPKA